jgi:hypothetical protein
MSTFVECISNITNLHYNYRLNNLINIECLDLENNNIVNFGSKELMLLKINNNNITDLSFIKTNSFKKILHASDL